KRIHSSDFIEYGRMGYILSTILFVLRAKEYCKPGSIIYTRDSFLGLINKGHILELHDMPRKINRFNIFLWKRASKFVVKTEFIKKMLSDQGFNERNIKVVFNGVDTTAFYSIETKEEARRKLNLPQDKKIILYSGTFYVHDWKGVNILLEANKELSDDVLVILVGGTKDDVKKINNEYLWHNVKAYERVLNQEIPLFLRSADVLILPNKKGNITSELYTSPLKLFEYMASKTPIIASDLLSIKEVVNDEEVNFFTANDPHSLALTIKKILSDLHMADSKANKAFQKVQNFSWRNQAEKILQFIKE
ncbi:MAG: glycosyltransferase, partial [Minisyncoccia bacterium]